MIFLTRHGQPHIPIAETPNEDPELPDECGHRPAIMARVGGFIESLLSQGEAADALLVGHGASIGAAVRYFLTRIPPGERPTGAPGWNCALTAVRLRPRIGFDCLTDVDHLLPEQVTSNRMTAAAVLAKS